VKPAENIIAAMATYHEELAKAGVLVDASGLQASSKGFKIKYSGNKRTVVDGPFTEAKDLYTIIQVNSREEAVEWAKRYPNPHSEGAEPEIEVRRFFELEGLGPSEATERFRKMEKEIPKKK